MSSIRNQLIEIIDSLPEQKQVLLFEVAKRFVPNDVATVDDPCAMQDAHEKYILGETVSYDNITRS